jgi:hypothetical protein
MLCRDFPSGAAGRDRIRSDPHFLAFKVFWLPDSSIRPHYKAAVMETAHQKDRQRDVGRTASMRDHVGRRRHLADVEFKITHHAPECADDRNHLDKVWFDPLDQHLVRFHGARMTVVGGRDLQPRLARHVSSS